MFSNLGFSYDELASLNDLVCFSLSLHTDFSCWTFVSSSLKVLISLWFELKHLSTCRCTWRELRSLCTLSHHYHPPAMSLLPWKSWKICPDDCRNPLLTNSFLVGSPGMHSLPNCPGEFLNWRIRQGSLILHCSQKPIQDNTRTCGYWPNCVVTH